jgi:hypothetical protein
LRLGLPATSPWGTSGTRTATSPCAAGLDRVDVTLTPAAAYTPTFSVRDDYRCFLLDTNLNVPRFITGFDVDPGQRAMVHHVLLYAVDESAARAKDAQTAEVGWPCFGGPGVGGGTAPPATIGTWLPGSDATHLPDGTGIALGATQAIAMQIHYNFDHHGHASVPSDLTTLKLRLEPTVALPAQLLPIANAGFSLAPGQTTTATATVPSSGKKLYGLIPHMHRLGTQFRVDASSAGCLIHIPEWDFHWQQDYFFDNVDFVQLGTLETLTMSCTWNNTTSATVGWGENSDDEMCLLYVYVTN